MHGTPSVKNESPSNVADLSARRARTEYTGYVCDYLRDAVHWSAAALAGSADLDVAVAQAAHAIRCAERILLEHEVA